MLILNWFILKERMQMPIKFKLQKSNYSGEFDKEYKVVSRKF